jgi:hypothetical protein
LAEERGKDIVTVRIDATNTVIADVVQQGGALDIRLHQGKKRKAEFPVLEGTFVLVPVQSGGGFVLVPIGSVVTPETVQKAVDKMNVRYTLSDPEGVVRMITESGVMIAHAENPIKIVPLRRRPKRRRGH